MSEDQQPIADLLDEAIEAFQRLNAPDRPPDAQVLALLDTKRGGTTPVSSPPSSKKRAGYLVRILVPSAAAALLLMASVGVLLLNSTAPTALGDVVKAAVKHKLVRYKEEQITDTREHIGAPLESTVYADLTAPRLYSESRTKEPGGEAVQLTFQDGRRRLVTNSLQKTASLGAPKDKSLLCCLEEFQQKNGVTRTKERLGGIATVKYRHEDDREKITLWVDANTRLPVRMEQEFIEPTPGIRRNRLVWTDFAWDPELPKGFGQLNDLFSTRPPQGYILDDRTKEKGAG